MRIGFRSCVTVAAAVTCGASAVAQPLPGWVDSVAVTSPGTGGIGAVSLQGVWLDTCAPDAISHEVLGNQIHLSVSYPGLNVGCGDMLTPWALTEEFRYASGEPFQIFGTLFAVDPSDRGNRQWASGPDLLYQQVEPPTASFHGLGGVPDTSYVSRAFDVSATGHVVVGRNELEPGSAGFVTEEAFVWSPKTGMVPLGVLPGGIPGGSTSLGVSPDGHTVVGKSTSAGDRVVPFRWRMERGMEPLRGFSDAYQSEAVAASSNGRTIEGTRSFFGPDGELRTQAYRWTRSSGAVDLGSLVPYGNSAAVDVSADGRVIVGSSVSSPDPSSPLVRLGLTYEPFRWTAGHGMVGLGHLPYLPADVPNAYLDTRAHAVSAGGDFVVGVSSLVSLNGLPDLFHRAFVWNQSDGMVDIGNVPWTPLPTESEAVDVSADGEVVVGNLRIGTAAETADWQPFIWDVAHGLRMLEDVLRFDYGLDQTDQLDGWQLEAVSAISDDASTIVGTGTNPLGVQEAWRVVLQRDDPVGDTNFGGVVDFADYQQLESHFGAGRRGEPTYWNQGDFDGSGLVDQQDFALLSANYQGSTPLPDMVPEPLATVGLVWGLVLFSVRHRTLGRPYQRGPRR